MPFAISFTHWKTCSCNLSPFQVVGSQARILYTDAKGRASIAVAFNKAMKDGRIKVENDALNLAIFSRHLMMQNVNELIQVAFLLISGE